MQAAFERVSKGRTTVAVAHRLATIQSADIIYVLGEGKVLEKGTHAELLRQKGVYWHMVCAMPLTGRVSVLTSRTVSQPSPRQVASWSYLTVIISCTCSISGPAIGLI